MPIKSDEKESQRKSFQSITKIAWNSVDDEWCTLIGGMCITKKLSNNQFLTHIDFKLLTCHPIKEQN